jgi:hypothetical protein
MLPDITPLMSAFTLIIAIFDTPRFDIFSRLLLLFHAIISIISPLRHYFLPYY